MTDLLRKFGFSDAEIDNFWANAQQISFRKKQLLLEENQINRYLYLVKGGVIRSYVTDKEGKDYTKSFFSAKDKDFAISFSSFKYQEPSNLFLEAVVDTEVWAWHYSYIHEKLINDFRFLKFFRHCMDLLYFRFEKREIRSLRSTPEERYIFFKEEHPDLINTIPLHYIATYLGVTAETLSRIRKRVGNQ